MNECAVWRGVGGVQLKGWRFEHTNLTTAHTNSDKKLIYSVTNYQTNKPETMLVQEVFGGTLEL